MSDVDEPPNRGLLEVEANENRDEPILLILALRGIVPSDDDEPS